MDQELTSKKCTPCTGDVKPLKGDNLACFLPKISEDWEVKEEHYLQKEFRFKNFKQGLNFVNQVGQIAEEEGHHPDIYLTYGKVVLRIWTHKIKGLSENDFILAAKCDQILK